MKFIDRLHHVLLFPSFCPGTRVKTSFAAVIPSSVLNPEVMAFLVPELAVNRPTHSPPWVRSGKAKSHSASFLDKSRDGS